MFCELSTAISPEFEAGPWVNITFHVFEIVNSKFPAESYFLILVIGSLYGALGFWGFGNWTAAM